MWTLRRGRKDRIEMQEREPRRSSCGFLKTLTASLICIWRVEMNIQSSIDARSGSTGADNRISCPDYLLQTHRSVDDSIATEMSVWKMLFTGHDRCKLNACDISHTVPDALGNFNGEFMPLELLVNQPHSNHELFSRQESDLPMIHEIPHLS